VDTQGRAISLRERFELSEEEAGGISTVHPSVADGARSLRDKLEPGVWYMSEDSPAECEHREISEEEKELLVDLLSKILVFDPKHRISTQEVAKHIWFRL
jgi:serine/threonine protein kinase